MVVVIVGKKVIKKAVNRNLLKRRLREIFKDSPTKGIVYARKGIENLTYKELKEQARQIIKQLN